jgi:RHS repeat-associated protein
VFGERRSYTGNADQSFAFTGEQVDNELGLVYLRARYYDPVLGRFLGRDHFAGYRTSTQSLNRFIYTQNNPVRLTDPSGNISINKIWNDYISPYGQKAIDYGVAVAKSGSTYLKLTGQGLSRLGQNVDTIAQIGGAYKQSRDLYEFAEQSTRDEDLYWAYRYAKNLESGEVPSREYVEEIRRSEFHIEYKANFRAIRDLGMGVQKMFGSQIINWLSALEWKTPETDREYQQWLQEDWQRNSVSSPMQDAYGYEHRINRAGSSPTSSGK